MDASALSAGVMKSSDLELGGMEMLVEGKLIDRSKVGFRLQQYPEQKEFFRAMDNTIYHKSAAGQLRRINKKKTTKAEKKAAKRDKKKTLFAAQ